MLELTTESFDQLVEVSDIPVVVDFWSPTCTPCRNLMPNLQQAEKELKDQALFTTLNIIEDRLAATGCKVMSVPTIIIFKDGKEVARKVGYMETKDIVEYVKSNL